MREKENEEKTLAKLSKTLRPQPKSRFLPGQVSNSQEKMDLQRYIKHRVNVIYAHSRIDNKPPKFPLEIYYDVQKLQEISNRIKSFDNEKMKIMQKMNTVLRSKAKIDCWNKSIAPYEDKIKERMQNNKMVLQDNKTLMLKIKKIASDYCKAKLLKDWENTKVALEKQSKYPSPLTDSDTTYFSIIKEPSETEDPKIRIKCFFEIQLAETKQNLGRIIFELYSDYVPRTCANFEALCRGTNGLSYKGTKFHRILPGYWCQGGDVKKFNGTGGTSIYGDTFEDENFSLTHADRGVISMWSDGENTNNSKFNITFRKLETMDGKRVVFGKIIRGLLNLQNIEEQGTKSGKVLKHIIIANCGVLRPKVINQVLK